MSLVNIAHKYLEAGFNVIPVSSSKMPSISNWRKYQEASMTFEEAEEHFADATNIAVLCGGKTRVVCLDADMKYDLSGDLWKRFKKRVPKELLEKMMCQETQNKGFHLVFKAPSTRMFGNEKLAGRHTTAYEKHQTYMEAFENPETRDKAIKIASHDKSRILFETRSGTAKLCGGYFLIAPSKGYKKLYGKIGEITEEEYDTLMEVARSFNDFAPFVNLGDKAKYDTKWTLNPFDDYNERGDVLGLLIDSGWELVSQYGRNAKLKRPGKTPTLYSAILDTETNVFNCYSTSTEFDTGKGLSGATVFIVLECEGNAQEGYKRLVDMGYGKK